MNGVMSASVSPGSSQRETSVTWTPMVSVPSVAAGAGDAPARMPRATTAATSERARISGPPVGGGCQERSFRLGAGEATITIAVAPGPLADTVPAPDRRRERDMKSIRTVAVACLVFLCELLAGGLIDDAAAQAKPEGEMRWAMYVTLAPVWLDPGESVIGVLTPFWILYAIHDALVKPMPGNHLTPSLAESWTVSPDGKTYEF